MKSLQEIWSGLRLESLKFASPAANVPPDVRVVKIKSDSKGRSVTLYR